MLRLASAVPRAVRPTAVRAFGSKAHDAHHDGHHDAHHIDPKQFPGAKDFMEDIAHFEAKPAFQGKPRWMIGAGIAFVLTGGLFLPFYQVLSNPNRGAKPE